MPVERRIRSDSRRENAARLREGRIAELAGSQHGVVSRAQMKAMGFEPGAIERRVARRRLHVIHRGVYAVGHSLLSDRGRWMAAVLAGGSGAALSHLSAAALFGLGGGGVAVDVSVRGRKGLRAGIRFHRTPLPVDETCTRDGIAATTVARTLFDLASVLRRDRLEQVMTRAESLQLADCPSLPELMERYPGRRGIAKLRAILAEGRLGLDMTRSELEIRFLEFLRDCALPRPEINVRLDVGRRWIEVDCLWRDAGLVVELDSRAHHGNARAFEADRVRDRALTVAGFRCIRVTWRQLHDAPEALAADLRSTLASSKGGFDPTVGLNAPFV
jgi:very-short-patch-repair endonuclease